MKRPHPRADLYKQARAQGMTYSEIGRMYGVSYQAVSQACGSHTGQGFQPYKEKGCIYPNLRRWLNDNRVSRGELARRMGPVSYNTSATRMSSYLRGETDPPKRVIDKWLRITGMTYEVMFYQDKTKEEKTNDTE